MGNVENYVFHYTGKLNQSYVMITEDTREAVYEAVCEKIKLFSDTPYVFHNIITGKSENRMISHTVTTSMAINSISGNLTSSFDVDKQPVWNVFEEMGYGFHIGLRGIAVNYEITHNGEVVGSVIMAGTGAMNPKYSDSAVGKMPAKGIFRVNCAKEDIEGAFMLCFALSRTDLALDQLK